MIEVDWEALDEDAENNHWKQWYKTQKKFQSYFKKLENGVLITKVSKSLMDFVCNLDYSYIQYGRFRIEAGYDYTLKCNCLFISSLDEDGYLEVLEGHTLGFGKDGTLYANSEEVETCN